MGSADKFLDALVRAGLGWHPNGQATLSGPLYRLAEDCDRGFLALADAWRAEPEEHPAMVDAAGLQAIDYLSSFPHLATFPICLDADDANLREFTGGEPLDHDADGRASVRLTRTAAVREVLTPAACYHVYLHHRGEALESARHITIRNTCFRRESHYEPLRRQWSFRMREVICLGTRSEVLDCLERTREAVDSLCGELDLKVTWEVATDPFFQPAQNPQYLAQRVRPTKFEARFADDLAIASVNMHEDHFGTAYDITRDGHAAASGCVAFGIERWLYAVIHRYGPEPGDWPDVTAAARRAATAITGGAW